MIYSSHSSLKEIFKNKNLFTIALFLEPSRTSHCTWTEIVTTYRVHRASQVPGLVHLYDCPPLPLDSPAVLQAYGSSFPLKSCLRAFALAVFATWNAVLGDCLISICSKKLPLTTSLSFIFFQSCLTP